MKPEAVLRTFSQLSSSTETTSRTDLITDARLFVRQTYSMTSIFAKKTAPISIATYPPVSTRSLEPRVEERLLSISALHKNEQLLRIGWLWFSGTVEQDGSPVQYCFPALSIPVKRVGGIRRVILDSFVEPIGDAEMTELINDPAKRAELVARSEFGGGGLNDYHSIETGDYRAVDPRKLPNMPRLNGWIQDIARAVGLQVDEIVTVDELDPLERRKEDGICAHVCAAMYLEKPAVFGTRRESLLNLAGIPRLDHSAFARIYDPASSDDLDDAPVASPVDQLRPVSVRQRQIATDLLANDLSVLSGAPGTGKSHLLTVAALAAVSRGQSVLVAASSPYAVDVLVEHFANAPGPTPVVFGGSSHGQRLATELAVLVSAPPSADLPRHVADEHGDLQAAAVKMLNLETDALRLERDPARRIQQADDLRRAGDLVELEALVESLEKGGLSGWLARRRHGDEVRRRLSGEDFRSTLDELKASQSAQTLLASGGLTLTSTFDHIAQVETTAADQRGKEITASWLNGLSAANRRALMRISSALTVDRGTRRRMLQEIDPVALVSAAPLWVGSVRDIDSVLPAVSGLFDWVILDEASQIDQINAANALVRAKRAIICGDPEQIGHVSFLSDADVASAASMFGTDPSKLDPRRQSVFDAAAGVAPTQFLDEHFRSAPHLIEFSSRQIYKNGLHIASRHPRNEAADHIDVHLVDGTRDSKKVNAVEVEECLRVADEFIENGVSSIGFVSPFRAQADAIEEALLKKYRLDEIEHYGLRVGTVHSFQGDERKLMIASWAVGEDEGSGAWRFVNQRTLFNVMVTRARDHMVVVTSTASPPGLAGEYVRWAEPLTDLVGDVEVSDPWVHRVAGAVRDAGGDARVGYRAGRYVIDLVVGSGEHAIAVDCSPHVDGTSAHIDRALQLRRTGWHTADGFQSRWDKDLGSLAVELTTMYEKVNR